MKTGLLLFAAAALAACHDAPAPVWSKVMTLAGEASNPTVAVDPHGTAFYVAWVGAKSGASDVWLARSADGATFDAPVRVNHLPGDAAPHEQAPAQVDVGPDGNVYVVWQKNTPAPGRRFPFSDLRFARSLDGGRTFEPAITVNDDSAGPPSSHTFHDLLATPDGSVYVSWIDGRAQAAREAAGGAAGDGEAMHDHGGGKGDPPGPEIRVARSTDGGRSFGPGVVVAANACPCCRTSLAVGPDGDLYIAWRTVLAGDVRDVVVARSTDQGATFTPATRVQADDWVFDACPHAGPSLAVDEQNRLHVAWYTGAAGRPGIYTAISADHGATFSSVKPVLSGEWVPPSQIKLATHAAGRVIVAWDDRRAETPAVHIAWADAQNGRLTPEATAPAGTSPALAAAAGSAVVAWLDADTVRVRTLGGGRMAQR